MGKAGGKLMGNPAVTETLVETRKLKKYFSTHKGPLHAVDDVNISIAKGETLGLVGESGCGKSTLGRVLIRLLEATDGSVLFGDHDIVKLDKNELRNFRKRAQMVFQDPYSSLNPRLSVEQLIAEPLRIHKIYPNERETSVRIKELMDTVGLAQRLATSFPHELDGGRRQRIGVARALALNPEFIVLDEPVSALDVCIQAQILNLLQDLKDQFQYTYLFITHDLSVVKHISDHIAVMYLGQCVEYSVTDDLFDNPLHPYTRALLAAIPTIDISKKEHPAEVIAGEVTSPINPAPGCRFAARCGFAKLRCMESDIPLRPVSDSHSVACIL
jgi:peptide/nickel transport system ATP-binding protein